MTRGGARVGSNLSVLIYCDFRALGIESRVESD